VDVKDFCPISLVGGVYKIISTVLANWLKKVLEKIISSSQNAFIRGGRYWIQFWLSMNVWVVEFDQGTWFVV
jgi:hypothetical protein